MCVCVYRCRLILSLFITVCANVPSPPLSLTGGYENFHSQYPELCTEVKTIDQSGTETEKRVNNHSETLSHHKPDYDQVWKHPIALPTLPRRAYIMHLSLKKTQLFLKEGEKKIGLKTLLTSDKLKFGIKTFSQHKYDIF